jgi:hypothetical protein
MCNIMRCICVASIVMSKQSVLHILCAYSHSYPTGKVHMPCGIVYGLSGFIFPQYLSFGKMLLIIKCVLIFCTILSEKFLILTLSLPKFHA